MAKFSEDEQDFMVLCSSGGNRTALIKNLTELVNAPSNADHRDWISALLAKAVTMSDEDLDEVISVWKERVLRDLT